MRLRRHRRGCRRRSRTGGRCSSMRGRGRRRRKHVRKSCVGQRCARVTRQVASRFTRCRKRLTAALEESKEVRRAAKDTLSLQAEVARVTALLSQAGVDARKRSTMVSLRTEVGRLSADLKASQAEKEALASRVEVLEAELATSREQGDAFEVAVRAQERAAGQDTFGASARTAARRRAPWPHPTARAGGEERRASPGARRAPVCVLRQALCGERRS